MILTKEMAEKAKALIGKDRGLYVRGVCWTLKKASEGAINVYSKPEKFWRGQKQGETLERWPLTPEGDIKRRAFIDSLIGKDL